MKFKKITVCLDMHGCPNRCKHCWLGATPNGSLNAEDLRYTAEQFRPYTRKLEVYDWYREPDYGSDYKEMWELCEELSDVHAPHFELVSFWRLARDEKYAEWLADLGMKYAQLTIFGDESMTDYFVGRRGAYIEILRAIDVLLENGICPRIQMFVNERNIGHLNYVERLINGLELERRCRDVGGEFSFFLHAGSCDGENEQFYDKWVTPQMLERIPKSLAELTVKHFGKKNIYEVFGEPEHRLYKEIAEDNSVRDIVCDNPVFYVDKDFNVYPNISAPTKYWSLGNLKSEGIENVLDNYRNNLGYAEGVFRDVPLSHLVKTCGARDGMGMFTRDDYIIYLLNKYCRKMGHCYNEKGE